MKLSELDAVFLRTIDRQSWREVQDIAEAQGVRFLCPKCFAENGGPVGTATRLFRWSESRGTPAAMRPGPGRWLLVGTGIDDLTLNADPPRTARCCGCQWRLPLGTATSQTGTPHDRGTQLRIPKAKISAAKMGHAVSQVTREKIRATLLARNRPEVVLPEPVRLSIGLPMPRERREPMDLRNGPEALIA